MKERKCIIVKLIYIIKRISKIKESLNRVGEGMDIIKAELDSISGGLGSIKNRLDSILNTSNRLCAVLAKGGRARPRLIIVSSSEKDKNKNW